MTDEQKDGIIALAQAYMQSHKDRDRNRETISQQRVLLFMALERAEVAPSEPRRSLEEGAGARPSPDGSASDAISG